jgi:hypothetical protein
MMDEVGGSCQPCGQPCDVAKAVRSFTMVIT